MADPTPAWCGCLTRQRPGDAARDLADEFRELCAEPSWDEWSDVWFALGRLAGAVVGTTMVPMPFTGAHRRKIGARMAAHGCVRSARHLVNGTCPSTSR